MTQHPEPTIPPECVAALRSTAQHGNPVEQGRAYRTAGASNRTLAKALGITEGSIRNAVLYARAADLAGTRPGWPTVAEIAGMSIRQVRALLDGEAVPEPTGLRRLKAAWQQATEDERATFATWSGLTAQPAPAPTQARLLRDQLDIEDITGNGPPPSFGQMVRQARQAKGWTQKHLADLVGYSRGGIANIEADHPKAKGGPEIHRRIMDRLGMAAACP